MQKKSDAQCFTRFVRYSPVAQDDIQSSPVKKSLPILCLYSAPTAEYGLFRRDLECARAKGQVCNCAQVLGCAREVQARFLA